MMKFIIQIALIFSTSFSRSFAQVESKSFGVLLESMLKKTVPTISCEQLKNTTQVILLDAREKREFEVSHLKDARWIGYETFSVESLKDLSKETPIVVYCSIGVRSEKVGEKLQKAGFKNIKNLYGSIFEWVNEGNVVYDMSGKPTKKIHAYNRTWGVWCRKGEKVYE